MKLGIAYNVFNGEELLEASIMSIRNSADFVCIVMQQKSNFGQPADKYLVPLCHALKKVGLVDNVYEFIPQKVNPMVNEVMKRTLSYRLCKDEGCTHFMSMDTDELYIPEQFEYMKKVVEEGDFDSSACQMQTYWKEPCYRITPPEQYYVPLIYKIREGIEPKWNCPFPVTIDHTRGMEPGVFKKFKRDEIEMHHLSYVRDNIRGKFENSTARCNFNKNIDALVSFHENWEYPNKACTAGITLDYWDVEKVDNIVDKVKEIYKKSREEKTDG